MSSGFMVELVDAVAIVIGVLLAIVVLYTLVRVAGKAWYRSKREEESATVRRIKDHFNKREGGGEYGNSKGR